MEFSKARNKLKTQRSDGFGPYRAPGTPCLQHLCSFSVPSADIAVDEEVAVVQHVQEILNVGSQWFGNMVWSVNLTLMCECTGACVQRPPGSMSTDSRDVKVPCLDKPPGLPIVKHPHLTTARAATWCFLSDYAFFQHPLNGTAISLSEKSPGVSYATRDKKDKRDEYAAYCCCTEDLPSIIRGRSSTY